MAPATVASGKHKVSHGSWRKGLLACGIVSSLLYGTMIWAIRYEGYSLVSQVPSELTAVGAPTQSLWMLLGPIYTLLVAAFGWGVWQSAGRNRTVRIVGGLILAFGSLGLLWPFAPMHQREVLAAGGGTLGDTMHVVLGGVMGSMGWSMVLWWGIGLALLVLIVWLLAKSVGGFATRSDETPEQILKRRYARGEIEREEYQHRLDDLRR